LSHLAALRQDAASWSIGRSWLWRLPILLYLVWAGVRHLQDPYFASLFSGITLGIHELGHLLLAWAGRFLGTAGGSLAQIAAPVAAALLLLRQRDYFGVAVGGSWVAFALFQLATYVGDARAQELPLVGLTPDPVHDWNWLLDRTGLLPLDRGLAGALRVVAFAVWAASIALGGWLLLRMTRRSKGPRHL
jgi:hypothetical protein